MSSLRKVDCRDCSPQLPTLPHRDYKPRPETVSTINSFPRPTVSVSIAGPRRYHHNVVRFAILTLSDRVAEGTREDASGDRLVERITAAGHEITARTVLPDDRARIAAQLRTWCDTRVADIVITTGGTGLTERDVTPEATRDIAERDVPGIVVALHLEGLKHTPLAVLSRGLAVTRGQTLVVNLPGSPSAMDDGMDVILPLAGHIQQLLAGPVEHSG